jgi:2-phosphosulfolactate phosphatase
MRPTIVIDCLPESAAGYRDHAIVAIDVIRATTTAISAVAAGRRCYPVPTVKAAFELAAQLPNALLAGEQRGMVPDGFHLNNSPAVLSTSADLDRPVVLLSSSGTRLCHEASKAEAAYLACLRNYASIAKYVAPQFSKVAIIGAGTRGEFREEDQMCCAWIAETFLELGYQPRNDSTARIVEFWRGARADSWLDGKSAGYLRNSGQTADLDFVLAHIGDLDQPFRLFGGEVVGDWVGPVRPERFLPSELHG